MSLVAIYFLFSVGTVFIVAVRILNLVSLRLKSRDLLGRSFKKGTPEHKRMVESIDRPYIIVTALALLLSLLNLIFAAHEVIQSVERQKATSVILWLTFMALAIVIGIVLTMRSNFGESAERHSVKRHNDDNDW